jgi:hypothetical protein
MLDVSAARATLFSMTQAEQETIEDQVDLEDARREVTVEVGGRRNERSEISFPYSSLEDAEAVAHAVFEWGGNDVSPDRIAATLDTTVKSSGFRTDVAAARTFGFIDGRGTLSLTPLGHRLVDDKTTAQARVEAFKQVPLFNAIFQQHQGKVLPGTKGIESEMLRLGVSSKQVTRARQLFQRSAQHAGFFDHSSERLVEPLTTEAAPEPSSDRVGTLSVVDQAGVAPQAMSLLTMLLAEDAGSWSDEKIAELVRAARTVQNLFK